MLKTLSSLLSTFFFFAVIGLVLIITSYWKISQELPDFHQLAKYEPAVTTRLYAGDGQVMMEYATEKRLFVPEEKIPDLVKKAFIAAEDKNFYTHSGVDITGIARAVLINVKNIGRGRRPTGASTITQQVAKNFLLSSELSYVRKIKEAILATKIEQAFTKQHILELYLNEIYLGNRAYGVAAAALNYFGKSLDDLSLEEIAYLAALPKGPNNYQPSRNYEAAVIRRNWVIDRMVDEGFVDPEEAGPAKERPLVTVDKRGEFVKGAEYFSEEVRRQVKSKFGEDALYEGGLLIRTTLDPRLQAIATRAFQTEIRNYDLRHGWRGPLENILLDENYRNRLQEAVTPPGKENGWLKAVVLDVNNEKAVIETEQGASGEIPIAVLDWARKNLKNQSVGNAPKYASEVLSKGDVILVEKLTEKEAADKKLAANTYYLRQVPDVEGGLVALDPHTGKVLAMVGGYSFKKSQFNRVTQALRQTGSSFKPIVYLAALDNGYSPTDLILDAPFVLDQGPGQPKWKPVNYSKKFYGLMTLRQGIEKSRNLMTVRLAQDLGMKKVAEYAKKLGVNDKLPALLSMSLGAGETRLINMASAYGVMVNGGKKVSPYLVERIQDRQGKTLYKHDERPCEECTQDSWRQQPLPKIPDDREQVVDPLSAYQIVSILEGAAQHGTAARLRALKKHIAGKTGTTNKNQDAWFVGFSPDLVVAVYVGFDEPRSLGRFETGAGSALPIFLNFMKEALADQADIPFRIPAGIKLVRVNHETGKPAQPTDKVVITEALKPEFKFDSKKQRVIGSTSATASTSDTENTAAEPVVENDDFADNENTDFQLGTEY